MMEKLRDNKNLLKEVYYQPNSINIGELINYLKSISGNDLKLNHIRQYLFKTRWKKADIKLKIRCNVKAAAFYLIHLQKTKETIDKEEIKIIIADIIRYVASLDPKHDTSFIWMSTNTLPSTVHFEHAQSLFYNHKLPENSKKHYDSDFLVLYALRLALENRIHGILGIDYVNSNNKPISLANLILILKDLNNIEFSNKIRWDEINWVNKWLNHYMHRHIRPYPWVIHQAFEILNNILKPSTYNNEKVKYLSFYASTVVRDQASLDAEIISKIKESYTDVKINWANEKEILLIK